MSDNIAVARLRAELDALKRRVTALEAVPSEPEAAAPEPELEATHADA